MIIYEQASRVAQTLTTACRECCPMQHTWFQKVTIALHAAQDVVQDTIDDHSDVMLQCHKILWHG